MKQIEAFLNKKGVEIIDQEDSDIEEDENTVTNENHHGIQMESGPQQIILNDENNEHQNQHRHSR